MIQFRQQIPKEDENWEGTETRSGRGERIFATPSVVQDFFSFDWSRSRFRNPGLISGKRHQRPVIPVHVVLEIKDQRESGSGNECLAPRTVRILVRYQIFDSFTYTAPVDIREST
jgi:hypothetical protein